MINNKTAQLTNRLVIISKNYNKYGNRISNAFSTNTTLVPFFNKEKRFAYADVIEMEKDFGKSTVTIVSRFDKNKKLVYRERILTKNNTEKLDQITKFYRETGENIKKNFVNFFKIDRIKYKKDKVISSEINMLSIPLDKNPDSEIVHSKLKTKITNHQARKEEQIIRIASEKKGNQKYIKTIGKRKENGEITLKSVETNIPELKNIEKTDQYLMTRMYNNKDFCRTTEKQFAKRFNVENPELQYNFIPSAQLCGSYDHNIPLISINPFFPKSHLTKTIAHETRHRKQHLYIEAKDKTKNNREKSLGKHFYFGLKTYALHLKGLIYPLYRLNAMERDAFKTGKRFKKEFENKTMKLYKQFPDAHPMQFGMDDSEILTPKILGFKKPKNELDLFAKYINIDN